MWCSRMDAIAASRHEEFEGRSSASGNQAELYTELNSNAAETNRWVISVTEMQSNSPDQAHQCCKYSY